ncbi:MULTISPECIES: hypothetical protein [Moorena]|nr:MULTISPECIES: hypothetical protein [Moorena]
MARWPDGQMGEIFIKGNYPDMILPATDGSESPVLNQRCPMVYSGLFPLFPLLIVNRDIFERNLISRLVIGKKIG